MLLFDALFFCVFVFFVSAWLNNAVTLTYGFVRIATRESLFSEIPVAAVF